VSSAVTVKQLLLLIQTSKVPETAVLCAKTRGGLTVPLLGTLGVERDAHGRIVRVVVHGGDHGSVRQTLSMVQR